MKKQVFICLAVLLLAGLQMSAQDISFDKTTHDFGAIKKNDLAETVFTFTNTSDKEVKLHRVKASCGCTTPFYTQEKIAPGNTGEIKVKYNTARVGAFTKSVTVTYDTASSPVVLYIKGKVEDSGEPKIVYKHMQGGIAFDQIQQNAGVVDTDKEKNIAFHVKNMSPKPINIKEMKADNAAVTLRADRTSLAPGQAATITAKMNGSGFTQSGPFSSEIEVVTDDQADPVKKFTLSAQINKIFTAADLASQPSVNFEQRNYNAGKVLEGEQVVYAYKFTNTGKADLEILSVKASCGCTATEPKEKIIAPGKTSEIVATFNSKGRSGMQNKSITVKTNDPEQPTVVLRLSVEVEKDPFHISEDGPVAVPGSGFER